VVLKAELVKSESYVAIINFTNWLCTTKAGKLVFTYSFVTCH